ncbi:MAG TPA: Hsp70 family protein, partial [Actinomycetes bacterium]|nr:Hsp70 family protein [Actinomycetes bacterium]
MYALGVDLGTTFTAAAVWRDGRAEVASLGGRAAAIPSVVLLREDETLLTGESANRRALTEPHRVAREFKRRLGDTTPILLAGSPYPAEALIGRLLRSVVDEVVAREGGPPERICVSHPANWGPYKIDLLRQAVRISSLEQPVTFTTEPEAAAIFYAHDRHLQPGVLVAVYDLGGGTFDAAVLRKTEAGFAIVGHPEGIERLGGIDFDAAVFNHVSQAIDGRLAELDEGDFAAIAAVGRLREECVDAKEALSTDTDVSIPVLLPNVATEVRLTRSELEGMVRPALYETIEALRRALRSAGVTADQLHSVLLVGGSSRMPIVAQLVGAELGRPVAVDAHPKHAIALGAAFVASGEVSTPREVRAAPGRSALTAAVAVAAEEPVAVAAEGMAIAAAKAAGAAEEPVTVAGKGAAAAAELAAPAATAGLPTAPAALATVEPVVAAAAETAVVEPVLAGQVHHDHRSSALDREAVDHVRRQPDAARDRAPAQDARGRRLPVAAKIGIGVLAVAAGATAAVALNIAGGGGANTNVTLAVAQTLPVGRLPDGIVVDHDNALWVASVGTDEVTQIDPDTGAADPVAIGPQPLALAVTDDGGVWVTIRRGSAIARIDPASGAVTDELAVGASPSMLAVGAGSLWVTANGGDQVDRVDPQDRTVIAGIDVPSPNGIAVTDDAAWV